MRSFPILLMELLLSLSLTIAFAVPNTRHDDHRLIGRAGEPAPIGVRPDRPEILLSDLNSGPHKFNEEDLKVISNKPTLWHLLPVHVFDSESPDLPKEGSLAASFIKTTKVAGARDRVEVVLMPNDMLSTITARLGFEGWPKPNSGKGLGPLEPGSKTEWKSRTNYGSSTERRILARLQAWGRRLQDGKGNEPEGMPVNIGTLKATTEGIAPNERAQFEMLMKKAIGMSWKDGFFISYGVQGDAIAPEGVIMTQPPSVGAALAKPFKTLLLNLQKTSKVVFRKQKPQLAAEPPSNAPDSQQEIQRRIKRSSPLSRINDMESGAVTGVTNTTDDLVSAFEEYYSAFAAVQANSTALILPFLDTLTNASNSSLVFDAAWSIWNDLTIQAEHTAGPFLYGMHCLDQIEDEFLQQNNLTTNSTEYLDLLALDSVLIDAYESAWNQSLAAMQQSGLHDQIVTLAGFLATAPPGIQPTWFNSTAGQVYDDQYFVPHKTPI